jgi:hypothetical protein
MGLTLVAFFLLSVWDTLVGSRPISSFPPRAWGQWQAIGRKTKAGVVSFFLPSLLAFQSNLIES